MKLLLCISLLVCVSAYKVIVYDEDQKQLPCEVSHETSIEDLQYQLYHRYDVDIDMYGIQYDDEYLDPRETCKYHGVRPGSQLYLKPKSSKCNKGSCGDKDPKLCKCRNGRDGRDGPPGQNGLNGLNGASGASCTIVNITAGGVCGDTGGYIVVCPGGASSGVVCFPIVSNITETLDFSGGTMTNVAFAFPNNAVLGQGAGGILEGPPLAYNPGNPFTIAQHMVLDQYAIPLLEGSAVQNLEISATLEFLPNAPKVFLFNLTFYVAVRPLPLDGVMTTFPGFTFIPLTSILQFSGTTSINSRTVVTSSNLNPNIVAITTPCLIVVAVDTNFPQDPAFDDMVTGSMNAKLNVLP